MLRTVKRTALKGALVALGGGTLILGASALACLLTASFIADELDEMDRRKKYPPNKYRRRNQANAVTTIL